MSGVVSRPWVVLAVCLAGLSAVMFVPWLHRLRLALACGLCGALWFAWALIAAGSPTWASAERRERVLAEVHFVDLAAATEQGWHALAEVRVRSRGVTDEPLRRVRVSAQNRILLAPTPGERWQLVLGLREPRAALNPGAVDMERAYFTAGLAALASVRASPLNRRIAAAQGQWLARARWRLAREVASRGVDRDADALFLALAAGISDGFSDQDWQIFNATGTSHLVAISGTHVTGLAALLYGLAVGFWRLLPRCGWRIEREHFASTVALTGALAYALFAGFSVPTQRTLLMLAIWRLARIGGRHVGVAQIITLALLAVVLIDPFAPLAAGFWLSFIAMGVLLWQFPRLADQRSSIRQRLGDFIRSQWAITLALAPVTALIFHSVPLAGLWVNALAIPFFTVVLVPLALLGAGLLLLGPAAGVPLLELFAAAHRLLASGLAVAAASPLALWRVPDGLLALPVLLALAACLLLGWPWRLRVLGLTCTAMLLGVILWYQQLARPLVELLALESGSGMSVIVRTRSHAVVMDTGDTWQSRGAASAQRLLPSLRSLGLVDVDLLILGRPTADRGAGVARLTAALPVRSVVAPPGWQPGPLRWQLCRSQIWTWDGVDFELSRAGGSCVLHVSANGRDWWLAATLSAADEVILAAALKNHPVLRQRGADLAVMRTGAIRLAATGALWRALNPRFVIAAGQGPSGATPSVPVWRTGDYGAVRVRVAHDAQIVIQSQRLRSWPWPWRRPGA